jgi:Zn-dependent protease with chaperone function
MNSPLHAHHDGDSPFVVLPSLRDPADLQIELLREPKEQLFLTLLFIFAALVLSAYVAIVWLAPPVAAMIALYVGLIALAFWFSVKMFRAYLDGNSVQVSPHQYPQIFETVRQAAAQLAVPMPHIFVMQGAGFVDILVGKHFTRRGYIVLTSDLMDALLESATSRELLMLIGRQLGHIKAGHFKYWFLKNVIGMFAWLIHAAYWRRAHLTADRVGLLVAGDLYAAEQALLILTVGPKLAAHTNMEMLDQQAEALLERFWPRLYRFLSEYPHMMERIARLRHFATTVQQLRPQTGSRPAVGALPIRHLRLKALPVMMVHGHDHTPLLELKDFLRTNYPYVEPVVMSVETFGTAAMPEKFERLASQARGAIAILTPDDLATAVRDGGTSARRARQNVVLEIGWFWGRLGRSRCLLLSPGKVEIPSDLAGVECLEYIRSPREHFESVRDFIGQLERAESGGATPLFAGQATEHHSDGYPPSQLSGSAARAVCPTCHEPVVAGGRFCEYCGTQIATAHVM